jgi:hypothetical protein
MLASTGGIDKVVAFDNLSTGSVNNVTDGVELVWGISVTAMCLISRWQAPTQLYTSPPDQARLDRYTIRSRAT